MLARSMTRGCCRIGTLVCGPQDQAVTVCPVRIRQYLVRWATKRSTLMGQGPILRPGAQERGVQELMTWINSP